MPDLGIIFQYHQTDVVTLQNACSLLHNTKNPIIPIKRLDGAQSWYDGDVAMYEWYAQRKIDCARWLYLEWDAFCNQSVEDFYRPVWNENLAGAHVVYQYKNEWPWFKHVQMLPNCFRQFSCGIWPLNGILMSDKMLSLLSKTYRNEKWSVISELRIATIAMFNGIIPAQNVNDKHNDWHTYNDFSRRADKEQGIWHPIKVNLENTPRLSSIEELGESFLWPNIPLD